MSNVRPITDLENYREVLEEVSVGNPVYLTEGKGERFVLMKEEELERFKITLKLFGELMDGERSGREDGWIPLEDAFERYCKNI